MFKLQRLEITGFKSFADHTDLIFTGDGITAIVGPNGCGKSNLAEAIAWVLGEQRVKHLRGSEMKDVIFQGSRNRAPSGMAEVVLHLVRDETVAHEPDIEDIDSTLEEIDEHSIEVEQRLTPEAVEATAPVVQPSGAPGESGAVVQLTDAAHMLAETPVEAQAAGASDTEGEPSASAAPNSIPKTHT
ncbi:MAG TPA: AAA family ATPase, partial [Pyrinomonadaceae bacterium]|nr:AAA family ATPase [Pyrinomonadaceae bacterium]